MMLDLRASATSQIGWLKSGRTTSLELLEVYFRKFQASNPEINAVVATDFELARRLASELDQRRSAGEDIGTLCGLPMTIKDTFDVENMPAVCGAPQLASRQKGVQDSYVAKQLKAAGAVIWGKTNTPLFAGDAQTYNEVYGVTNNPFDLTRSPGGSSGGSAAAVASAMTPLEVGSDIAGSIRNPAHSCGICALKPSWGLISTKGHVPPLPDVDVPEPDLAVAGPMARSVDDLRVLFSVLAPTAPYAIGPQSLADVRVAIWREPSFPIGMDVDETVEQFAGIANEAGAATSVNHPAIDPIDLLDGYQRLLISIITAGLPRRTKILFQALSPITRTLSRKGKLSLSSFMRYALQSDVMLDDVRAQRDRMKAACDAFFESHDVLIAPVLPIPALPHNNKGSLFQRKIEVDNRRLPYTHLFDWTALASHCHLPVVTIPGGKTPSRLPIGLQLIGREGSDHRLLNIAQLFETALKEARA